MAGSRLLFMPSATDTRDVRTSAEGERVRIRRFDADRTDTELSLQEGLGSRLTSRQLLWIDVLGDLSGDQGKAIAERFELDQGTYRALEGSGERPLLAMHGSYFHIRLAAEPDEQHPERTHWLDVVAGPNVAITRHQESLALLDGIDRRIAADSTIGKLDSPMFVASLLDAVVTSYFRAADAIEDEVDELDAKSLQRHGRAELLSDLVGVRRRIARLRRSLANHRELFSSLATADFVQSTKNPDAAPMFQAVAGRFESALGAVEDSRDVVLGSFDVFMTRTAQRTNDVMKVLALATVLLLPGSLIAGLLGMNVTVPLGKDDPSSFWIVVGLIVLLAAGILGVARARSWL
jgi:magnesium transporter